MTKCAYRNCEKSFIRVHGVGRNRQFCNDNCKQMEIYHRKKHEAAEYMFNTLLSRVPVDGSKDA